MDKASYMNEKPMEIITLYLKFTLYKIVRRIWLSDASFCYTDKRNHNYLTNAQKFSSANEETILSTNHRRHNYHFNEAPSN